MVGYSNTEMRGEEVAIESIDYFIYKESEMRGGLRKIFLE